MNIYFDIETSSIFLDDGKTKADDIDILMYTLATEGNNGLEFTTRYAEDETQVHALLEQLVADLSSYKGSANRLVTFNGESFDLPVVRKNIIEYGISGSPFRNMYHCDVYKSMLAPNVYFSRNKGSMSLKTLAKKWLGVEYDMSGDMFFDKMYEYWDTGDEALIGELVHYNQLDVQCTHDIFYRALAVTPQYWSKGKSI